MLQGQVLPILLYGVECWLGMKEEHYQQMEDILKKKSPDAQAEIKKALLGAVVLTR